MIFDQYGLPIGSPNTEEKKDSADNNPKPCTHHEDVAPPRLPQCQQPSVTDSNADGTAEPANKTKDAGLGSKLLVFCNIVLALASIYSAFLTREAIDSNNQSSTQILSQMRRQNWNGLIGSLAARNAATAASNTSTDTHTLAEAAKIQAGNTTALARSTQIQALPAKEQVSKLDAGTKETHALAEVANKSAQAANAKAQIAGMALEANQRPWVSIHLDVSGPMTFDSTNGATLPLNVTCRNTGGSAAMSLGVFAKIAVTIGVNSYNPTVERDQICQEAINSGTNEFSVLHRALFNGDTDVQQWTIGASADDMRRLSNLPEGSW
jgi:hypothetical protein